MPIRPDMRALYPADWRQISLRVRYEIASGRCQHCGRPDRKWVRRLDDGRWFDDVIGSWRNGSGDPTADPQPAQLASVRATYVVLAAAHVDHAPQNCAAGNLRAWCQRCHLLHDAPRHRVQRWITMRRRYACGDLFWGDYRVLAEARTLNTMKEIRSRTGKPEELHCDRHNDEPHQDEGEGEPWGHRKCDRCDIIGHP